MWGGHWNISEGEERTTSGRGEGNICKLAEEEKIQWIKANILGWKGQRDPFKGDAGKTAEERG